MNPAKTRTGKRRKGKRVDKKGKCGCCNASEIARALMGNSASLPDVIELPNTIGVVCDNLQRMINAYDRILSLVSGISDTLRARIEEARADAEEAFNLLKCDETHIGAHWHLD
jgi:hypothetical protein